MKVELMDVENVILEEIAVPEVKRKSIAQTYAFGIGSSEDINWKRINEAIVKRWSISGLNYIKRIAWKMVEHKNEQHRSNRSCNRSEDGGDRCI